MSTAFAISDLSDDLPTGTRRYDRAINEADKPSAPFVPTRPAAIEPEPSDNPSTPWDDGLERAISSGFGNEVLIIEIDNEPRREAKQDRNAIIENG